MRTLIRWLIIVILLLMTVFLLIVGPRSRAYPAPLAAPSTLLSATPVPMQQAVASPTPGTALPIIPQTGPTPAAPSSLSSMVQVRDEVCVRRLPYTILSLPGTATFEVILSAGQDPSQFTCNRVLAIGGTQTVVCTGHPSSSLTLRVTNDGFTEDVAIPLRSCDRPGAPDAGSDPLPQPTTTVPAPLPQPSETQPVPVPLPTETLPAPTP